MVALIASLIAVFGIVAFAGAGVLHERWLLLRIHGLARRFRCGFCGYSFAGIDSDTCPECGKPRGVVAQLDQRHRLKAAVWFGPMLFAALLALLTSDPRHLVALALGGSVLAVLLGVASVRVPMMMFFVITAGGLILAVLAGLGHHEYPHSLGAGMIAALSASVLILGNVAAFVFHLFRRGPIHPDRPSEPSRASPLFVDPLATSSSPSAPTPPPPPRRDPSPGSPPSSS